MKNKILYRILFVLMIFLVIPHYSSERQEIDSPSSVFDSTLYPGFHFRCIGPHRGGRVTAVTGHASQPSTFYMGGTGGGIWKTTDNGQVWTNISDGFFEVGSIGAIDVADSDPIVIFVGTGSAAIRSNVSTGRGIYKSNDGGKTWTHMGLRDSGQIGALIIHPQNPEWIYAAALGHPFGPNSERGVFRTRDGGKSWQSVMFVSESTGAIDLAMNPSNPDEIYAAMWRGERKPWTIISGSEDGGIFKTRDGGDTWEKLSGGLPQGLVGKISLSIAPSDPARVYALVEAPNDRGGVYRSDDGGATWSFVNSQKSLLYRPFYYTYIDADPKDPDKVYVNNEGFFISLDGGKSFKRINTPHGDNHGMWINPDNPEIFIQSNDGGANITLDGGKTWSSQNNQATAEMYHVVVDNRIPYWVYGEQQDNSTIRVPSVPPLSNRPLTPFQFWEEVAGCETGPIAVHPYNPDIVYGGCKGRFSRYNHATGQMQQYWVYPYFNYGHAAAEMPYRFQRTSPIEISPHNPKVIYHASHVIHKTTDEGVNWEIISPDLTAAESDKQGYSGEPITRDITGEEIYSAVYALRESPHEQGVIWAGSNDGLIHITRNGGKSWTNVTPSDLPPGGRVQTIEPSPHRKAGAYVVIYRYMLDDWRPYIYKSENYGADWTLITDGSNGIPSDFPTRVVREDPDREGLLYAGTEFGLFISFDNGLNWRSFQLDLPVTPVTDIKIHRKDLVLSTMGRSFWILDDITPLHQWSTETNQSDFALFQPRDTFRMRWSGFGKRPDRPEYPDSGVVISYYLGKDVEEEVRLFVRDSRGNVIRRYSSGMSGADRLAVSRGMHRISWDMRYPGPFDLKSGKNSGRGPLTVPGIYQIRFMIGEMSQSRTFEILMDPRVAEDGITQKDLEQQLALNLRIREAVNRTRKAVVRIRSIRADILREADISAEKKVMLQSLSDIEEALIQTREGKVGAQLKPMLDRQLTYLFGMTTQADQKPGRDAYARIEDIEKELDVLTVQLAGIIQKLRE